MARNNSSIQLCLDQIKIDSVTDWEFYAGVINMNGQITLNISQFLTIDTNIWYWEEKRFEKRRLKTAFALHQHFSRICFISLETQHEDGKL